MPDIFLYTVPAFASPNDIKLTDPTQAASAVAATQSTYPVGGAFRWPDRKKHPVRKRRRTIDEAIADIVDAPARADADAKELVAEAKSPERLIETVMVEEMTNQSEDKRRAAALLVNAIRREAFEEEDWLLML